ncbi:hypothetical protein KUA24_83 [Vibrio phage HNL01]|nr:hypothetical protein KUA24_83 [Vibrio phage HNL01]
MEKVKIRDIKVFEQVAKVIGEKNAEIELFKASKSWDAVDVEVILKGGILGHAFKWESTVQGRHFWSAIDAGSNPYKV